MARPPSMSTPYGITPPVACDSNYQLIGVIILAPFWPHLLVAPASRWGRFGAADEARLEVFLRPEWGRNGATLSRSSPSAPGAWDVRRCAHGEQGTRGDGATAKGANVVGGQTSPLAALDPPHSCGEGGMGALPRRRGRAGERAALSAPSGHLPLRGRIRTPSPEDGGGLGRGPPSLPLRGISPSGGEFGLPPPVGEGWGEGGPLCPFGAAPPPPVGGGLGHPSGCDGPLYRSNLNE